MAPLFFQRGVVPDGPFIFEKSQDFSPEKKFLNRRFAATFFIGSLRLFVKF
jgi:hypothetical protein